MTKFVSLCVLAYKRPEQLKRCLDSLVECTRYPYELIVNLDGYESEENQIAAYRIVNQFFFDEKISKLILVGGKNRGVGRSMANCIGVSEGDYICKIDTDLTFTDGWLSKGVEVLESTDAGAVGFFDYKNYDPNDTRFHARLNFDKYMIVEDLVSSAYLFHRDKLEIKGWDRDDGYHQSLKPLAIVRPDVVHNHGFGVTKSVYVSGTEDHPIKTKTYSDPRIFKK